jgi:3-oxoadipate enol-lactonase
MPFAPVQGGQLYYSLDGDPDSPVLLLSNSLGTDHSMWQTQVRTFSQYFRLLRYDSRGHGASTVIPGEYTIEMLARDVLGLLDHLGIGVVSYCGLSIGGMTGQWLALNGATRLDKLVLCNTAARFGNVQSWNERMESVRAGGLKSISQTILSRWFTESFRCRNPETVEHIRKIFESISAQGYLSTCSALRDIDLRDQISRIRLKTLVITGTHDTASPPADGRFLAEHIPGAQCVELDSAHLSNVELPDRFSEEVLKFLAS